MDIALAHHVYSSLAGYRTLYSTPGLPPECVQNAEAFARRCYRLVGRRPLRAHFRPAPGWGASVRALQFGTDHVGRPRTCVHTIFLRDEETVRHPWYSPFQVPDSLFLTDGIDLQYVAQELAPSWDAEDLRLRPDAILERFDLQPALLKKFVPAMLDGTRPALVLDAREQAHDYAALISYFLPPEARRTLTYLDRAFVPPVDGAAVFKLYFFGNRPDPSILEFADWIILDLDRNELVNPPPASAWATFLMQSLGPGGRRDDAVRLLLLLEHYERRRRLDRGYVAKVIDGFRKAGGAVGHDGRLAWQADPDAAFDSLPSFSEAGCANLVLAMLNNMAVDVSGRLAGRPQTVAKLRVAVEGYSAAMGQDLSRAHQVAMTAWRAAAPAYGRTAEEEETGFDPEETLTMPEPPSAPKADPTPLGIPSAPVPDPPTLQGFSIPDRKVCPSCGLPLVQDRATWRCDNPECTYRSDLDFDV